MSLTTTNFHFGFRFNLRFNSPSLHSLSTIIHSRNQLLPSTRVLPASFLLLSTFFQLSSLKAEMIAFNDFLRAGGMSAILRHAVSVQVDPMTPDPQNDKDGFVKLHLVMHTAYQYPDGSGDGGLERSCSPTTERPTPKENVFNLSPQFRGSASSSSQCLTSRSDRCDELCLETGNKAKEVLRVDEDLDGAQNPKRTPSVLPVFLARTETPPPNATNATNTQNATSRRISEESFSEIQPNEPLMEDIHANHETPNVGLHHDLNLSDDHVEELDSSKLLEKSCGRSMSRRSIKGFLRKTSNVARSMLFACLKGRQ